MRSKEEEDPSNLLASNPWGCRFRPLACQGAKHVLDLVSLVAWLSADDLAADGGRGLYPPVEASAHSVPVQNVALGCDGILFVFGIESLRLRGMLVPWTLFVPKLTIAGFESLRTVRQSGIASASLIAKFWACVDDSHRMLPDVVLEVQPQNSERLHVRHRRSDLGYHVDSPEFVMSTSSGSGNCEDDKKVKSTDVVESSKPSVTWTAEKYHVKNWSEDLVKDNIFSLDVIKELLVLSKEELTHLYNLRQAKKGHLAIVARSIESTSLSEKIEAFFRWLGNAIYEVFKAAIFDFADAIVLIVKWLKGAQFPYYAAAASNSPMPGVLLSMLLQDMIKTSGQRLKAENIHVIGFSLGAHAAGFCGRHFYKNTKTKLGRITGLDPAGPLFQGTPVALSYKDANFVDVIHTNAGSFAELKLGIKGPIGHVDFYPNGGSEQPGCNALHA
ncbi:hypothetical protein HPB50_003387 [Hyalomma asiaticum]|uniref:Uncharacterized protein n=1 Tax=Hyalomma asiaticum TaxID=266040 RepID=A0ACB7RUF4_HYAAI|nr:hypothetical protein HPB50_003387 [Hyalomma asiaticum]